MSIEDWYKQTVGADSQNVVAENAGIVPSSLYRQLPDKLSPQNVVKIAHAYGVPALEGLVALGLIDDGDLKDLATADSLRNASDADLLQELARRMKQDSDTNWNSPITYRDIPEQELAASTDPNRDMESETPDD